MNEPGNYLDCQECNMTIGYTPEGYALAMTYDAQNRMKTAQYTDGTGKVNLFEYAYAGTSLLDQLVKKENGTPVSTTKYLRAGFLPVQERDNSNVITREYTWGKNLGGGIERTFNDAITGTVNIGCEVVCHTVVEKGVSEVAHFFVKAVGDAGKFVEFMATFGICSKICHKAAECVSKQLNESTEAIINERYREISERYYQSYEPINFQY